MSFRSKYDIAIIGGGIGGLMTAHRLAEKAPELTSSCWSGAGISGTASVPL